jgi:lipopolysaccharide/colanic/teichoic acid biosynthesis glycosyltransferase
VIERILLIGWTPLARQIVREIECRPNPRHAIVGLLDDAMAAPRDPAYRLFRGPLRCMQAAVDELRPDRIVVALAERRNQMPLRALLDSYVSRGVRLEDASEFYERISGKLALESLRPMEVMAAGGFRPSKVHQAVAGAVSVTTALMALVLLSPVLAMIAALIKLDSPGPALFEHERVGAHGVPFTLLKFRTMHVQRERRSEWECDNRDRLTRVGRWLRRFRLDELPQFVNVLRGEMHLVGPRPHPVSNLQLFTLVARNLNELTGTAVSCYSLRQVVRPGLTGWAQVRYRYANNLEEEIEKLRFDLYYVKHLSTLLDMRILGETIGVVLRGGSAERRAPQPAVGVEARKDVSSGQMVAGRTTAS